MRSYEDNWWAGHLFAHSLAQWFGGIAYINSIFFEVFERAGAEDGHRADCDTGPDKGVGADRIRSALNGGRIVINPVSVIREPPLTGLRSPILARVEKHVPRTIGVK